MPSLRAAGLDSRPVWVWDIPSSSRLSAARCALRRQSMISEPPLLVSTAPKYKSVLVAWSLERYARHTQTVNLYAPLTLRFGLTHGRPCPQVWPSPPPPSLAQSKAAP